MPNEKRPQNIILNWDALHLNERKHRVRDGEDWYSLAKFYGLGAKQLIRHNFLTIVPEEVNWYLRHYVGCNKKSPTGNNWAFSNSASRGIIFIPPLSLTFEAETICGVTPNADEEFYEFLTQVASQIHGKQGIRIQNIIKLAKNETTELWYYSPFAIKRFMKITSNENDRKFMTTATNGEIPFWGNIPGQNDMKWQYFPILELKRTYANCGTWNSEVVKRDLIVMDAQAFESINEGALYVTRTTLGGGDNLSPLEKKFAIHFGQLVLDTNHIYSNYNYPKSGTEKLFDLISKFLPGGVGW